MKKKNVSLAETLSLKNYFEIVSNSHSFFILEKTRKNTRKISLPDRPFPSALAHLKSTMETPESFQSYQ